MTITEAPNSVVPSGDIAPLDREKLGRRWVFVSFIFCPCHLPMIMAVLGVLFGGSAFGALVGRNTIAVGIVFGAIYLALLTIGFRHLRSATKGIDCTDGLCTIS